MDDTPIFLVDGRQQAGVAPDDRGLQYGDGVFRTMLAWDGEVIDLQSQLDRLRHDAGRLHIPAPDDKVWHQDLASLPAGAQARAAIKLILTRGSGQRGYAVSVNVSPTRLMMRYPLQQHPASNWQEGIKLGVCATRLGHNPALSGIKHLNRLEQVLARSEPDMKNVAEGLMLDQNKQVISGTMSNLFLFSNGKLYTPVLDQCGVSGVMREKVIDLARQERVAVAEERLTLEDCLAADECFVTNSLIGIWPVRQLQTQRWRAAPLTRHLQARLNHPCIPTSKNTA